MHGDISSVAQIISISLIIFFSPFFAKIFKLPTTPIEIVFGSLFGFLGFIKNDELFEIIAHIGFLYLMFIAGTEINLKRFVKIPKKFLKRIFWYIFILYLISITFTLYFELGKIFVVLLPLISVGLVAALAKEYGKQSWIELSMMVGGIGEVVSIGILTVTAAALKDGFSLDLVKSVVSLNLFLVFMYILFKIMSVVFWWSPELSHLLMPEDDNKEQDIRLSLALFSILVATMIYLHLELAFGAFLAGIFLPTFFEHKKDLPEKLASFGFGFLIPVFFIYIGSSFDLKALMIDGLIYKALIITFVMIFMRIFASFVFIKKVGFLDSLLVGLSHSMPLTLLIAMATLAYNANSIDKVHYYAFILASLFQVLIVMSFIKVINVYKSKKIQNT